MENMNIIKNEQVMDPILMKSLIAEDKKCCEDKIHSESYESIVSDLRAMYKGKISEVELHTATKNLIRFFEILLK